MNRWKPICLAALALAPIATPAHAQRAARQHNDGAYFCETRGVVLRHERSGGYTVNFLLEMPGDTATARLDGDDLFPTFRPRIILFYSGRLDADGEAAGPIAPFAVTGTWGTYSSDRPYSREAMRLVIEAGGVRSEPIPITDFGAGNREVSGSVVEAGGAMDANDKEIPRDEIIALTDAVLANGARLVLLDGGREIASVAMPSGSVAETRRQAIAWVDRAYPFLREGNCPA